MRPWAYCAGFSDFMIGGGADTQSVCASHLQFSVAIVEKRLRISSRLVRPFTHWFGYNGGQSELALSSRTAQGGFMNGSTKATAHTTARHFIGFGVLVVALTLASCGYYKQEGTVEAESGTVTIPVTLRWLPDGGTIAGTNPNTGEAFKGQYYDLNTPPPAVFRADMDPQQTGATFAYGTMQGSQGSVLHCRMIIGTGLPPPDADDTRKGPHGLGQCLDSMGMTYVMEF